MRQKKLLLPAFLCLLSIGLTGCGHEHVWVEATCLAPRTCCECGETEGEIAEHKWIDADCEKAKYCEVCGETEGEPLSHSWTEATYTAPKTCSQCGATEGEPLPQPYCLERNITFETLEDMDLSCAAGFSLGEDGYIMEITGLSADEGVAHYTFGEITTAPSGKEGCIDVMIPLEVAYSIKIHQDIEKCPLENFGFRIRCTDFSVGDYYTGQFVPAETTQGSGTQEFSKEFIWGVDANTISYTKDVDGGYNATDWVEEGDAVYGTTINGNMNMVYTITIPEEYDGAVLCIERNGVEEVTNEDDVTNGYFLDEHEAEYYRFYRLSDLIS